MRKITGFHWCSSPSDGWMKKHNCTFRFRSQKVGVHPCQGLDGRPCQLFPGSVLARLYSILIWNSGVIQFPWVKSAKEDPIYQLFLTPWRGQINPLISKCWGDTALWCWQQKIEYVAGLSCLAFNLQNRLNLNRFNWYRADARDHLAVSCHNR